MKEPERATPNLKLRYERERRAWSQQEVADKVGTTPLNVGRWERGTTMPGPHFRHKLCEIFEKNAFQLGLAQEPIATVPSVAAAVPFPSTVQAASTLIWNVPYNRNLLFTGREAILSQLSAAFLPGERRAASSQPQAISGLGGVGKTQIAIEYAYRYREHYETVLWARADSHDMLLSDFTMIAVLLHLPQRGEHEQNLIVSAVLRWLDAHERWLLILDNADRIDVVSEFIPASGKGHVLLTTRAHSTGTIAQRIELDKMEEHESIQFLLRRAKLLKNMNSLSGKALETMQSQAKMIIEAVDGLPLALDQAGAYIEETGCSLSDYLKFYKSRRNRLLRLRGRSATGHPEPVATTWSLSFDKVGNASPAAAELLCLCAFLHPDAIPEAMIGAGASELGYSLQGLVEDELELNEAIGELRKYSLVKRDAERKILNVHRLVQAVLKDAMDDQIQQMWAERIVRMMDRVFPQVEFAAWDLCQQYLPHAQAAIALTRKWKLYLPEAAHLAAQIAEYLQRCALYKESEPFYLQALAMQRQLLGPEHLKYGASLASLASLYTTQGKYGEAEPLYLQALAIQERSPGRKYLEVADTLEGLADLYHQQGDIERAEKLYLQTLEIREQEAGSNQLLLAKSFHNLAFLYHDQGKFEQAAQTYQHAITLREQELGPNHPDVAESLCNLGLVYYDQSKYEQAESFYLRALRIREWALGANHPEVAFSLNNLALLYWRLGRYDQAGPLYQRALALWEQRLGPNHSDVATCLNNLARLHHDQKNYEQAEELHQRALAIREQYLGRQHPDIAYSLNNLALLYQDQEKYDQAEAFHQRALALREQRLGTDHALTATSIYNLAYLYDIQGKYGQAEGLYQRALAIREQVLGTNHPDTVNTRKKYTDLLQKIGQSTH